MQNQTDKTSQASAHLSTAQSGQGNVLNSPRFQAFPMDEGNDQWGVRDTLLNKCWSDDGWQLHDSGWASVMTHEESLLKVSQLEHEVLGDVQLLQSYGYFAGARDPKVKPDFTGRFMVRDTEDDADGFCIVGDDLGALVSEALEHLDISPEREKGNVQEDAKEAAKHELQQALKKATECGFLDDLAGVLHPDAINQFCDAVDAFDEPEKALDESPSPGM